MNPRLCSNTRPLTTRREFLSQGALGIGGIGLATLMQQLGIEHTRLTFRHQGRDYRLTDIKGNIVKDMLA